MTSPEDFKYHPPTWCPGCGDYALLRALQVAASNLGLEPHRTVVVGGIGCSGKITDYFRSYGFHAVHGRTLPLATGVKLANRELTVIAAGGDGDGYSIGGNHLLHAIRRNVDITYLVFDNHVYGLTKGQTSPTSKRGFKTKSSPRGALERPFNPLAVAISCGITFLAQGFSGDVKQLSRLIEAAITHKGFALVNVFTPCVTYNRVETYSWYRENIKDLGKDPSYDPTDRSAAIEKVMEERPLCTGIIYQESAPTYEEMLEGYPETPLVQHDLRTDLPKLKELLIEEFL